MRMRMRMNDSQEELKRIETISKIATTVVIDTIEGLNKKQTKEEEEDKSFRLFKEQVDTYRGVEKEEEDKQNKTKHSNYIRRERTERERAQAHTHI